MSRKTFVLSEPKTVFEVLIDTLVLGLDHDPIIGFFIQGYLNGKVVLDRDRGGMACVPSPLGLIPMKRMELVRELQKLNEPTLYYPIQNIILDLDPAAV